MKRCVILGRRAVHGGEICGGWPLFLCSFLKLSPEKSHQKALRKIGEEILTFTIGGTADDGVSEKRDRGQHAG